jgi:hypothetical protein
MFWQIQKFTPDVIVKRCGVYAVLLVSILFNVGLMTRINMSQAAAPPAVDYVAFVRQVTNHLFDANYLTVRESMTALPQELTDTSLFKLKQQEFVPKNDEALEATARELAEQQSVSNVHFDNIAMSKVVKRVGNAQVPMFLADVRIKVAVHDNERVQETPLHLRYYIANKTDPKTNVSSPVVVDYEPVAESAPSQTSSY